MLALWEGVSSYAKGKEHYVVTISSYKSWKKAIEKCNTYFGSVKPGGTLCILFPAPNSLQIDLFDTLCRLLLPGWLLAVNW
ncbi:hypothetical protein L2E82_28335 [Cichorium intybus]|uniref:Uncharacterized protein n=1 Tax=Cichorium intybus TaxID=13427 RepID=A0ACB9CVH4_CICIN|nr:hypothetical protein L2E82_28335 [Cichorium intybus]